MFSYTITSSKLKKILLIAVTVVLFVTAALFLPSQKEIPTSGSAENAIPGGTLSERIAFLKLYGWECDERTEGRRELTIPNRFDSVYNEYNKLQKAQGFDLQAYHGKNVSSYSYIVTNYPGYGADSECIHATLIVFENKIIAGDISSTELAGFMHGFDYEKAE